MRSSGVPRTLQQDEFVSIRGREWSAPEYFEDLVNFGVTVEEWHPLQYHLCHDAPHRPHIESRRVLACAQKDLWCAVPECDDLQMEFNEVSKWFW